MPLIDALRSVRDDQEIFGSDGLLPMALEEGSPDSRFVIVTGDNATGKSLYVEYVATRIERFAKQAGLAPDGRVGRYLLSMGFRASGGYGRAMIMGGQEANNSTGAMSIQTVVGGLNQVRLEQGRKREFPCLLVLDEPDLGLSDAYATALGDYIVEKTRDIDPLCLGIVVVSHNRAMLGRLVGRLADMGEDPHHAAMGPGHPGLQAWLAGGSAPKSITELLEVRNRNRSVHSKVSAILETRKKAAIQREFAEMRDERIRSSVRGNCTDIDRRRTNGASLLRDCHYGYEDGFWARQDPALSGRTARLVAPATPKVWDMVCLVLVEPDGTVVHEIDAVLPEALLAAESWCEAGVVADEVLSMVDPAQPR